MKYLNEKDIKEIGIDWIAMIDTISTCVSILRSNDYSQPLKPYLRFRNAKNRIIAMPGFLGGELEIAGIKWIASFPDNLEQNLPRAHSLIILNDINTGKPLAVLNTALLSGIRTAAVSGFVLRKYIGNYGTEKHKFNVGIIGFGPIAQIHLEMLIAAFGNNIDNVYVYDIRPLSVLTHSRFAGRVRIIEVDKWNEVFKKSDILITCTVATGRYITASPVKGRLYLNVSLRDFDVQFLKQVDLFIVDDWDEVCRENTDIEFAHKTFGLKKDDVLSLVDILDDSKLNLLSGSSVMFNPMGMAVFDVGIGAHFYRMAQQRNIGTELPDS